jgi:hypothetical protein
MIDREKFVKEAEKILNAVCKELCWELNKTESRMLDEELKRANKKVEEGGGYSLYDYLYNHLRYILIDLIRPKSDFESYVYSIELAIVYAAMFITAEKEGIFEDIGIDRIFKEKYMKWS